MRKEESENKEKESFVAPVLSCASSALIDGAEAQRDGTLIHDGDDPICCTDSSPCVGSVFCPNCP
ncbi:hypothetical protein T03_8104 [Trichinella britovi]|uniref:Uncharacterized protein n=1 Tax=Trichinella britovi TaxID=45882 RepID=A0A0V1CZL0_TRIBR|nr:hypothetical protein T03_8104 [Trichinella britovi]